MTRTRAPTTARPKSRAPWVDRSSWGMGGLFSVRSGVSRCRLYVHSPPAWSALASAELMELSLGPLIRPDLAVTPSAQHPQVPPVEFPAALAQRHDVVDVQAAGGRAEFAKWVVAPESLAHLPPAPRTRGEGVGAGA